MTKITFTARCPANDILFTVALDEILFYQGHLPQTPQTITIEFDDSVETRHSLLLTMSGKTADHTKIDEQDNILEDAVITISDLTFDEIELGHVLVEKSLYRHDFNGTRKPVEAKFYGTMGCNGTVELDFYSPVYLWLLENI